MNRADLTPCDVCAVKLKTIIILIQLLTFLVAFGIGMMAFRFKSVRREVRELKTNVEQINNRINSGETNHD